MSAIQAYERPLFQKFVSGLLAIPGLSFYGITGEAGSHTRTPTAAFRLAGHTPGAVADHLAQRGVFVWAGNFYALAVTERLGLETSGGVVRAGLAHYNTLKAQGVDARLMWFPDENHWVLKPRNSRLWYSEFFEWLTRHSTASP